MIAAPSPRAIAPRSVQPHRVCPACRSALERGEREWTCTRCTRFFRDIAGIADLRLAPDRYLSLGDDRDKACRLAQTSPGFDESHGAFPVRDRSSRSATFRRLARAYYAMTDDVDQPSARRFLAHLDRAEERGEAFVDLLPRSGRVLEIGCGSGGMIAAAQGRGIAIEGVDIASRWLILAKERLGSDARLTAANAENLPWPSATFDVIFADSLVEHLEHIPTALREWHRVAKPGARLILISPNRYSLLSDPHVGLWGLGWLPRGVQAGYVRRLRDCAWPVRTRSAREVGRLAAACGWAVRRIAAAPAPVRSRIFSLYDAARQFPMSRDFLRRFGPLWLVEAVREASP
jgi:SAM-dependent methyltransferase